MLPPTFSPDFCTGMIHMDNVLRRIINSGAFCDTYLLFYDTEKCSDSEVVACFFFASAPGSEDEEIVDRYFQDA